MKMNRVAWLVLAVVLLALPAAAQNYPARPVKLVNGFPAGGSSDTVARIVAQKLSEALGQPVPLEIRTGAGGINANDFVAKSPADGYTLILITGAYPVQAALLKQLPYDPIRDFSFVSTLTFYPFVIAVNPDSPYKNLESLIVGARANPRTLSYSSAGVGTVHHLSGELFNVMAGTDLLHIPFRGGTAPLTELLAGRIDVMFETMTLTLPQIKAGRLTALAVTSKERSDFLPDVPTAARAMPGYEVSSFLGLAVAAGTPAPIVERLNREIRKVLDLPDVKQRLAELGGDARASTPEEMRAHIERESDKWRRLIDLRKIERQ